MLVERAAERRVDADREGRHQRGAVAAAGLHAPRAHEAGHDGPRAGLHLGGHLAGRDGRRHVGPGVGVAERRQLLGDQRRVDRQHRAGGGRRVGELDAVAPLLDADQHQPRPQRVGRGCGGGGQQPGQLGGGQLDIGEVVRLAVGAAGRRLAADDLVGCDAGDVAGPEQRERAVRGHAAAGVGLQRHVRGELRPQLERAAERVGVADAAADPASQPGQEQRRRHAAIAACDGTARLKPPAAAAAST